MSTASNINPCSLLTLFLGSVVLVSNGTENLASAWIKKGSWCFFFFKLSSGFQQLTNGDNYAPSSGSMQCRVQETDFQKGGGVMLEIEVGV